MYKLLADKAPVTTPLAGEETVSVPRVDQQGYFNPQKGNINPNHGSGNSTRPPGQK
jgi:hypothetical protein